MKPRQARAPRRNPLRAGTALRLAAWVCLAGLAACKPEQAAPAPRAASGGYVVFTVAARSKAAPQARRYADPRQALQAAADYRKAHPAAAIRILIEAGDYYLDAPLQIGPELSGTAAAPTQIVAAANAAPRLLAGRLLAPRWEAFGDGIYRAQVAGPAFDRLFVDGRAQVRARYPNFDPAAKVLGGYAADALAPARTVRWRRPAGGIVHALHEGRWGGMHIPILGRNADGSLKLGEAVGNNRPSPPHKTFRYVENVLEELDAPGEWYLDREASMLYFKPPAGLDLAAAKFEAGGPQRLLSLQGAAGRPLGHVRIAGLTLAHTGVSFPGATEPLLRSDWMIAREGAIYLENAQDVRIADNTLADLGGNAVFASGYQRRVAVTGNHIHDIGGSAISFVGRPEAVRSPSFRYERFVDFADLDLAPGPKTPAYPADSRAEDNLIHNIGLEDKQVAGVQLSMAMNIHVAHNTIHDTPRAGINIGEGAWGGHVVEYNDVFDTVLETGDHGAFNSWGRDRFWHPDRKTMERINAEHPGLWKLDVLAPIVLRYNRFHCDHGWDIDLDDGSSGYRIHDNVLLAGGLKFREGFDRAAWNNVLINNGFHPHVWFAGSGDRFERNIVMAAHQPILMAHWDGVVDRNLFPNRQALAQARALGLDRRSRYGDPRFVDAARGDYRVAAGSPALALGFVNFPMDRFGVVSARLKRLQRKRAPTPVLAAANAPADATYSLLGARIKTVATLGEQSATGLPDRRGVLVLQVQPGSLAAASGLQPGDVIVEAAANEYSPSERIDDASALLGLYGARRWRGSQDLVVIRSQRLTTLRLRFAEE